MLAVDVLVNTAFAPLITLLPMMVVKRLILLVALTAYLLVLNIHLLEAIPLVILLACIL